MRTITMRGVFVLSTSFGAKAEILLHMATNIIPNIPIVFVDTGYLFDETKEYGNELKRLFNLNLHVYKPLRSAAEQEAAHGKRWLGSKEDKAAYNLENKVEPMNRAMKELGATGWLAGLQRDQSPERAAMPYEESLKGGMTKYYPILDMTAYDNAVYRERHGLPEHPLVAFGYNSIGDVHSTVPGEQHPVCGLHERYAAPRVPDGIDFVI